MPLSIQTLQHTGSKLKVQVNESEYYTIDLYNFHGEKLTEIYAGVIEKETRLFEINLSHYPSGTYLIKITSNSIAHALKVNKVN